MRRGAPDFDARAGATRGNVRIMVRLIVNAAIFLGSAALGLWVAWILVDGFTLSVTGLVICAIIFATGSENAPTSWRLTRAGLQSGPRMLKNVRTPSARRTGPTCRRAGWNWGANRNAMPVSRRHVSTPENTCPSSAYLSV